MVIVKDQLDRIKANQRMGVEAAAAVETDITALLRGKTYDHLIALQKQIQAKLASGEPIDVEYWEHLLKKLLVWKAKVIQLKHDRVRCSSARSYCPAILDIGETQEPARSCCPKSFGTTS